MIRLVAFALESAISAQLVLFAGFLLSGRRRAAASYVLAGLSLTMAGMIAGNFLIGETGQLWLGDAVLFLDLLAPALAYLYVRQMRQSAGPMHGSDAAHLLPALVGMVAWKAGLLSSMDIYGIGCWLGYLAAAAYCFVRGHSAYAPAALRHFIVALLAVLATIIALRVVMAFEVTAGRSFRDGIPYLLVLAATFLATCQIVLTSLRHPDLLSVPGSHVKYAQSGAGAADLSALESRLEVLFRERKPYLDPDLTLGELSTMLDAPARHVSQLVNARFGMNFSAYVNQCRVGDAARALVMAPDKPIKIIMFESGFKSKSIFNREFQRCVGVSPSEFRTNAKSAGNV